MSDDNITETCRFIKKQYGIVPYQTWGSLRDLDLRAFWDKNHCNARITDTRVPTHLYWGNWNTTPKGKTAEILKQSSAVLINAFWQISAKCQIIGRNENQEPQLRLGASVLAGVGGWGSETNFAELFSSADLRARTIQSLGSAVIDARWQGIAIDWEYPDSSQEWLNLCLFLEEYRKAWPQQTLAVAVPADDARIPKQNMFRLSAAVDWIHVMTYDFTGSWSDTVQHNSSLIQGQESLRAWEKAGILRRKLMLGSAWYGRKCMAATIGAPASSWSELAFSEIKKLTMEGEWVLHTATDETPWMQKGGQLITFEDPSLVEAKIKWVRDNAFGGVFCWELGQDSAEADLLRTLVQI